MDEAMIEKLARVLANELGRQSLDRGQPLGTEDPDMMFLEGRFDLVTATRAVVAALPKG